MDLHKLTHEISELLKTWHLPMFFGLSLIIKRREEKEDFGELGENVPYTLIKSLKE